MERRLKERLTGAGILILLAVILIPLLLDDTQRTETGITTTNIPEKPDTSFSSKLVPLPQPEEVFQAEAEAELEPTPTPTLKSGAKAKPEPDIAPAQTETRGATGSVEPATGSVTGWVVQVGSFSMENAAKLNARLKQAGYRSYVIDKPVKSKDGALLYRVRVGPEILRSDALKLKAELQKEMKLDGIVLDYP